MFLHASLSPILLPPTSKTTYTVARRVGELLSIVVNGKRKMNVGNYDGNIHMSVRYDFLCHTVIYPQCLRVGKIKLIQEETMNKPYLMWCFCVFYCSAKLQLLKEAVFLWGGFDVEVELEI